MVTLDLVIKGKMFAKNCHLSPLTLSEGIIIAQMRALCMYIIVMEWCNSDHTVTKVLYCIMHEESKTVDATAGF